MRAHPAGPLHADGLASHEAASRPASAEELNRLAPSVWPSSARRNADGAIEIAGLDVRDAAAEHGTPLFLFDEADLRERARRYRTAYVDAGARLV